MADDRSEGSAPGSAFAALASLSAEMAALDPSRPDVLDQAVSVLVRASGLRSAELVQVDLRAAPLQDADDDDGPATALAREAVRRDGVVRGQGTVAVPAPGGALVATAGPAGIDEPLLVAGTLQLGIVLGREREARARRTAAEAVGRADARLQLLAGGGRVLAATLDEVEALTALARLLVPSLGDWCTVHLVDAEDPSLVRRVAVHADTSERRSLLDRLEALIPPQVDDDFGVGLVLRTGQPHVRTAPVPPASGSGAAGGVASAPTVPGPGQARALLDALGTRSVVDIPVPAVPVPGRPPGDAARPVGVLTLARGRDDPLALEDIGLASELAQRASLTVANARAFQQARSTALTLQRSLLPHSLPDVPGLSLASSYQPGGASHVGGDWYDAIPLADGAVGLVIGDVMGRGVRAAAVMGQLRAALRGYALEGHPPAQVVSRLDAVVEMLDVGFATCLYATLDPRTGDLEIAAAGHLPPLLLRADGSAELVAIDPGLPLGAGPCEPEPTRVRLAPGEAVVLYTDGLVESREQPVGDGLALLERRAAGLPREPDAALDVLLDRLDPRSGDDTALLVVGRDAAGAAAGTVSATPRAGEQDADTESHVLPHGLDAPHRARTAVRAALTRWGIGDDIDAGTLLLLTTELITNAVRHGISSPHLSLQRAGQRVRVAVSDTGPRQALLARDPGTGSESGRGLWLVEMMAGDWGVAVPSAAVTPERGGGEGLGKTVWFSVDLTEEAAEPDASA